jgi:hypothetical protein
VPGRPHARRQRVETGLVAIANDAPLLSHDFAIAR